LVFAVVKLNFINSFKPAFQNKSADVMPRSKNPNPSQVHSLLEGNSLWRYLD